MLFLCCSLLPLGDSQPVVSINPALRGAKHSLQSRKESEKCGNRVLVSQLFFMWELEMYLQNCIGYGSRSAGVIITVRCWLGHGVHITFSSPGFPVRDAAAWSQSDSDTINVYPRRYSMSSAVLPLP